MPRARNIKPSFFTNDVLADVDPLGRLLFIALWTLADREGRLEDRPKRIKMEALPYDDCNVDQLLEDLQRGGFIVRYHIGGNKFIQVVNFTKHQNPHCREQASHIPGIDQHCASTVQAPEEHGTSPADSGFLIPDSGSLKLDTGYRIPDSPIPSETLVSEDAIKAITGGKHLSCPQEEILALYAKHLPHLPQIRVWGETRAKELRARWHDAAKLDGYKTKDAGLAWWSKFFEDFGQSSIGHGVSKNGSMWVPDLSWMVARGNFEKIVNGNYQARVVGNRWDGNKQIALEERNRQVAKEWVASMTGGMSNGIE